MEGPYQHDQLVAPVIRLVDADPDPGRYLGASTLLRLGLSVAAADGETSDLEVALITEEIERVFDMPEHEERRLEALQRLLIHSGVEMPSSSARIQESLDASTRESLGDLLIAVAAVDGHIDPGERKVLKRCFRVLGLEPLRVDNRLRDLASADSPANVESDDITLDRDAIRAIREETREVAHRLAEAMGDGELSVSDAGKPPVDAEPGPASPSMTLSAAPASTVGAPDGLPARYTGFFKELVARPLWAREDIESLARAHDHMLAGALEAINDWAFDNHDGVLVHDDGDTLSVDTGLLGDSEA
jgi:tellurite resistance protein